MNKEHNFFVRFYGQNEVGVLKCMEALQYVFPEIRGFDVFEGAGISMSGVKPSHEVHLYFDSDEDKKSVFAEPRFGEIYKIHANRTKLQDAGVYQRQKGDVAFAV